MMFQGDPIGYAISEYIKGEKPEDIIVKSDLCEDDILPIHYLFRNIEEMPHIEQFAMSQCEGKILDIGAAAGCHATYLKNEGFEVTAVETSKGAIQHLKSQGINTIHKDFRKMEEGSYDTILILMNGVGLARTLEELPQFLLKLKSLLHPNGKILCDSTDIEYMYKQSDGSKWVDLNSNYYGEMQFNMLYKDVESGWFPWVYVDAGRLTSIGEKCGLSVDIIAEGDNNDYLAELKIIK